MYDEDDVENSQPYILPEVRLYWLTIAIFIAVAVASAFLKGMEEKWTYIQTVVLSLTLAVVAWNTYYTRKMQEAMAKQTNVSILPILELHLLKVGDMVPLLDGRARVHRSFIELENIGKAAAINVGIDPLFIKDSLVGGFVSGDPIWFATLASLQPQERKRIDDILIFDREPIHGENLVRPDVLKYLSQTFATRDYELIVRFTDVLGNQYAQKHTLGRCGKVLGIAKESSSVKRNIIKVKYDSYDDIQ